MLRVFCIYSYRVVVVQYLSFTNKILGLKEKLLVLAPDMKGVGAECVSIHIPMNLQLKLEIGSIFC